MIVAPIMRGLVCANAHPTGCSRVMDDAIRKAPRWNTQGPAKVLVIGASGGLGLAARTIAAFGCRAETVGVCLERAGAATRTATAGWYRTARLHDRAAECGVPVWTVVGDAFSNEVKCETIRLIKSQMGKVDLIIYSVAAPRRVDPITGEVFRSVIKTIGAPFTDKGYDSVTDEVKTLTVEAATDSEIAQTIAVMGGDDWRTWLDALLEADALADGGQTVAFSYVGAPTLAATYRGGSLGKAKDHLEETAQYLDVRLKECGGRARVAVMKALVTQASVVIPMSMLYTMLLYRVMAERGLDEGPLEQVGRLFKDALYRDDTPLIDTQGRLRLDDRELHPDVQADIAHRWPQVTSENLDLLGDKQRVLADVHRIYGFGVEGVSYDEHVDPIWPIASSLVVS